MTQRTPLLLLLGLVALFFTAVPSQSAPLVNDQTVKLSSGHTIKVLSVSKVEYSKGVMALLVRYQTSLSVEQNKALSDEVDDVWKIAVKDVEHYGYTEAIISSNEVPKGIFITTNRMLNFLYEKGSDGKWSRLNRADYMAFQ